jgi:hypothetical protein
MKFLPTLHIVVRPVGRGRYAAVLDGQEICRSEMSIFSAARQLLPQGYDPSTVLALFYEGSATIAVRSTIGGAAGLTVDEPDKGGVRVVRLRTTAANGVFTELPDHVEGLGCPAQDGQSGSTGNGWPEAWKSRLEGFLRLAFKR